MTSQPYPLRDQVENPVQYRADLIDAMVVVDEILANLYGGMTQRIAFRVMIHGEVLRRLARVRLVVADLVAGAPQFLDDEPRDLLVPSHSTPISTDRGTPFRTGVKLWIETNSGGGPMFRRRPTWSLTAWWYGQ